MILLLRLAWRNVIRAWWRTAVAIAAIGFGLTFAVFFVGIVEGMMRQMIETAVRTHLGHVVVHAAGYHDSPDPVRNLPDNGRAAIAAVQHREEVSAAPRLRGEGLVQSTRQSVRAVVMGVDPRREGRVSSVPGSIQEGSFLGGRVPEGETARRGRLRPIAIGHAMAERLKVGLGDKVVVHVPGETGLAAFRVRGIYRTPSSEFDGMYAFVRLDDAQRLYGFANRVTEVVFVLERPGEAPALQNHLRQVLSGAGVEVLRWEEREPLLATMIDAMSNFYWILYTGIFIAMAFGIANVQLMAVYERVREFGLLRAMGLRPGGIVAMVLAESFLLTMAGTGVGLGLAFALIGLLGDRGLDLAWFSEGLRAFGIGTSIRPRVGVGQLYWPAGIASVTALVSGISPAIRAARLRPAGALRHA